MGGGFAQIVTYERRNHILHDRKLVLEYGSWQFKKSLEATVSIMLYVTIAFNDQFFRFFEFWDTKNIFLHFISSFQHPSI